MVVKPLVNYVLQSNAPHLLPPPMPSEVLSIRDIIHRTFAMLRSHKNVSVDFDIRPLVLGIAVQPTQTLQSLHSKVNLKEKDDYYIFESVFNLPQQTSQVIHVEASNFFDYLVDSNFPYLAGRLVQFKYPVVAISDIGSILKNSTIPNHPYKNVENIELFKFTSDIKGIKAGMFLLPNSSGLVQVTKETVVVTVAKIYKLVRLVGMYIDPNGHEVQVDSIEYPITIEQKPIKSSLGHTFFSMEIRFEQVRVGIGSIGDNIKPPENTQPVVHTPIELEYDPEQGSDVITVSGGGREMIGIKDSQTEQPIVTLLVEFSDKKVMIIPDNDPEISESFHSEIAQLYGIGAPQTIPLWTRGQIPTFDMDLQFLYMEDEDYNKLREVLIESIQKAGIWTIQPFGLRAILNNYSIRHGTTDIGWKGGLPGVQSIPLSVTVHLSFYALE